MNQNLANESLSICAIGNIMLDVVTSLKDVKISEVGQFPTLLNSINKVSGGTGIITALASSSQGFSPVSLIGKIGVGPGGQPDAAGKEIISTLEEAGVNLLLAKDFQHPTGTVMITYFDEDARLLVADRGANDSFCLDDISSDMLGSISRSDILFVSGFMLIKPVQARPTVALINEAKKHEKLIVLDVVPHSIYKFVDKAKFLEYTKHVNVLISEIATLKRLFPQITGFDPEQQIDSIAEVLTKNYDVLILRPSNSYQYVFGRQGLIFEGKTGYDEDSGDNQRGYLDISAVKLLKELYHHFKKNSSLNT